MLEFWIKARKMLVEQIYREILDYPAKVGLHIILSVINLPILSRTASHTITDNLSLTNCIDNRVVMVTLAWYQLFCLLTFLIMTQIASVVCLFQHVSLFNLVTSCLTALEKLWLSRFPNQKINSTYYLYSILCQNLVSPLITYIFLYLV